MGRRALLLVALIACSGKKAPVKDDAAVAKQSARQIDAAPVDAFEPKAVTLDVSKLSRACATDADCVLVDVRPCSRCSCKDTPLAKSELGAFGDLWHGGCDQAGSGISIDFAPCIECEDMAGACVNGQCEVKTTTPMRPDAECATDADCVVSCEKQGECCPPVSCEDVVPRTKVLEIATYNRNNCDPEKRAHCPAPHSHEYLTPKCRKGTCYGSYK